ncbi:hypothetical protein NLI96_g8906 [Meripilus lineatus]|uniref:Cytochrome P450 n=1 Tax=Meripilus lineatus TaxID=2056292 RepID=A0AAD5UY36_9APHY|nr:hypothetical protein NLI96_g8906 [Physisporinus lineatus]
MISLQFALLGCLVWVLWRVFRQYVVPSPLDVLPGPAPTSFWKGSLGRLFSRHGWDFQNELEDHYDGVAKVTGMLGRKYLYIHDPKALNSIIVRDQYVHEPTTWFTESINLMFGPGLLATYGTVLIPPAFIYMRSMWWCLLGDHHRRQRKLLNPVFSINHMRHMTPLFYKVSHNLRDALAAQVKDGSRDTDMLRWFNRTALELIGQGGLGYSFDRLVEDAPNAFGDAMKALLPAIFSMSLPRLFAPYFKYMGTPAFRRKVLDLLPLPQLHKIAQIVDTMSVQAHMIFDQKREALKAGDEAVMQQIGEGRDIMSILLRANTEASEEDRLPENELIAQMAILVFAATDTTTSALVQTLQLLIEHPDVQEKVRQEIAEAKENTNQDIPYDRLVDLPLLDAVCRETLRLYPPVTFVHRETRADIVVPLLKPITGVNGQLIREIPVQKDTPVIVGLRACNRSEAIWGPDAKEWKPERWLAPLPGSVAEAHVPGVYSNLMTFLGGGRACIGFKFSQLEMKVVLAIILESFRFSKADNGDKVVWNLAGVRYPTVGRESNKPSFPMKVELIAKN